ncbi:hypothetical protein PanWU01x14_236150, partial [Parasponia andersonii]
VAHYPFPLIILSFPPSLSSSRNLTLPPPPPQNEPTHDSHQIDPLLVIPMPSCHCRLNGCSKKSLQPKPRCWRSCKMLMRWEKNNRLHRVAIAQSGHMGSCDQASSTYFVVRL